jgi:hypothetical protein
MKQVRWDLIAASAILGVSLVISAFLMVPPRYSAFMVADYTFVRIDHRSGEAIRCVWKQQCERVITQPPDDLDDRMANVANEIGDSK